MNSLMEKVEGNLKEFTKEPQFVELTDKLALMAGYQAEDNISQFRWDIVKILAIHSFRSYKPK